jgi:hypothetical protein
LKPYSKFLYPYSVSFLIQYVEYGHFSRKMMRIHGTWGYHGRPKKAMGIFSRNRFIFQIILDFQGFFFRRRDSPPYSRSIYHLVYLRFPTVNALLLAVTCCKPLVQHGNLSQLKTWLDMFIIVKYRKYPSTSMFYFRKPME